MGMKLKATSRLGKKRIAQGKSLDVEPPKSQSSDQDSADLLQGCGIVENDEVEVFQGEHSGTEGTVKWRGVQGSGVTLGLSIKNKHDGLLFVRADDCAMADVGRPSLFPRGRIQTDKLHRDRR